ncbi:hypothetical protein JG688_00008206 [Phytophthora aleatoria]|uniref:Uncharacterized protein n=1 Tax=Phytophthora aleatoria TaxID=2496075 RepID=A0A8J5IVZ8_9STRA|nr:hypothetical protein JG688_00008206 [Phytophthora aleatoria]
MKCSKSGCSLDNVAETTPCCVCSHPVRHICSNELCDDTALSNRFETAACVQKYKNWSGSQELISPVSSQGISVSSQATEVDICDLTSGDPSPVKEAKGGSKVGISDYVVYFRVPKAQDPVWDVIHVLRDQAKIKKKTYTHICTHKTALEERGKREKRVRTYLTDDEENKRPVPKGSVQEADEQACKRQQTFFGLIKKQRAGLVSKWLIRDGLPFNQCQTPAFRELYRGLTGDPSATMISSKTHNDILNAKYEVYLKDTEAMLQSEFR